MGIAKGVQSSASNLCDVPIWMVATVKYSSHHIRAIDDDDGAEAPKLPATSHP